MNVLSNEQVSIVRTSWSILHFSHSSKAVTRLDH